VPEAVLATIRTGQGAGARSVAGVDPALAAEVLTAVYLDTLTRWLVAGRAALRPVRNAREEA